MTSLRPPVKQPQSKITMSVQTRQHAPNWTKDCKLADTHQRFTKIAEGEIAISTEPRFAMFSQMSPQTPPELMLREVAMLIERRQFTAAQDLALRVTRQYPNARASWFLLGHIRQQRHDIVGAREAARQGLSVAPLDKNLQILSIELAAQDWEIAAALKDLRRLAGEAGSEGSLMQRIGRLFMRLNRHAEAERCYRRALSDAPDNPAFLYDLAITTIALGRIKEAESLLDKVIAEAPDNYNAYFVRATLRRQTVSRNHVSQLEALLSRPLTNSVGEIELCYGLAKELEDLGEYRRSFTVLKRGADIRRRMFRYDIDQDLRSIDKIIEVFNSDFFDRNIAGASGPKPIFILGLPRSGTTLVDRVLSSHNQVESLGETTYFGDALARALHPKSYDGLALIAQTSELNFANVGLAYFEASQAIARGAPRTIDKTPINFIYLGLIARALPDATIIHVRRDPMDICYAMYKTLFKNGFPFSYDLSDLAQYYLAYHKLMEHWRATLPGGFIELRYEDLVANQESVTRQLISECGLEWEQACLTPERNEQPSLTASASQVREKVYNTSVGLWRAYREELQPLVRMLREGGVYVGDT